MNVKQKTLFETWNKNSQKASTSHAQPVLTPLRTENQTVATSSFSPANQNVFQTPSTSKRDPKLDPSGFDAEAGKTWIYPTNYPVRDYQFSIVQEALFKNTLVILPTGLGKTFIAAVVMFNIYRWYPTGKVIFMAPTRPLVAQQIDACFKITGISKEDTTQMTGTTQPEERKRLWLRKRVFYLTPQVLCNDIARNICPVSRIKCIVVDEAHKALGNHAYCQVIREVQVFTSQFRVLALTATPGGDTQAVKLVLSNLLISHVELRTEDSEDVKQYTHVRDVEKIVVPLGDRLTEVKSRFLDIINLYLKRLAQRGVISSRNPTFLTKFQILKMRDDFSQHPPSSIDKFTYGLSMADFSLLISLYHAYELLLLHGARQFFNFLTGILNGEKSIPHARSELLKNEEFERLMSEVQENYIPDSAQNGETSVLRRRLPGHPKLKKLLEVVLNHFKSMGDKSTRVMIFSQYRDSIQEISDMLNLHQPMIKCMSFIGQASKSATSAGFSQKHQLKVLEQFRSGGYNTLVSTCVGEEGLDIGEVDLIVCYDCPKSPIRLVQRMGRTGRLRNGRIVILIGEGKEERMLSSCEGKKKSVHRAILKGFSFGQMLYNSPSLIPNGTKPICIKMAITPDIQKETTKCKGKPGVVSAYLTKEELDEFNLLYKVPKSNCHLLPKSKFLSLQTDGDEEQAEEEGAPRSMFSLSKWSLWQTRPQRIHNVTHSSKTLLFATTLEQINFSTDLRACPVLETVAPPSPGGVSPPFIDLCDDDDFFDPSPPLNIPEEDLHYSKHKSQCVESMQPRNLLSKLFGITSVLPSSKTAVINIEKPPNIEELLKNKLWGDFKPSAVREGKLISTLHILNKKMKAQLRKKTKELNLKFSIPVLKENETSFLTANLEDGFSSNNSCFKVDSNVVTNDARNLLHDQPKQVKIPDKSNLPSSVNANEFIAKDTMTKQSLPIATFDISFSPSPPRKHDLSVADFDDASPLAHKLSFSLETTNNSLPVTQAPVIKTNDSSLGADEKPTFPLNISPVAEKSNPSLNIPLPSMKHFSPQNEAGQRPTEKHLFPMNNLPSAQKLSSLSEANSFLSPIQKKTSPLNFLPPTKKHTSPLNIIHTVKKHTSPLNVVNNLQPPVEKHTSPLNVVNNLQPPVEKHTSPLNVVNNLQPPVEKHTSPLNVVNNLQPPVEKHTSPLNVVNNLQPPVETSCLNKTNSFPHPSEIPVKDSKDSPKAIEFDISFDMFQDNSFFLDDIDKLDDPKHITMTNSPIKKSSTVAEIHEDHGVDKNVSVILDQLSANHNRPSDSAGSSLALPLTVRKIVLEKEYKQYHQNVSVDSFFGDDSRNQMRTNKSKSNAETDNRKRPSLAAETIPKQSLSVNKSCSIGTQSVSGKQSNAESTQYSLTQMLSFIDSTEKFEALKNKANAVNEQLEEAIFIESSDEEIEPTPPKEKTSQFLYRNNSCNEDSNSLQVCDGNSENKACNEAFCEKFSFDLSDIKFSSSSEKIEETGDADKSNGKPSDENLLSPDCLDKLFFDISFDPPADGLKDGTNSPLKDLNASKSRKCAPEDHPDKGPDFKANKSLIPKDINISSPFKVENQSLIPKDINISSPFKIDNNIIQSKIHSKESPLSAESHNSFKPFKKVLEIAEKKEYSIAGVDLNLVSSNSDRSNSKVDEDDPIKTVKLCAKGISSHALNPPVSTSAKVSGFTFKKSECYKSSDRDFSLADNNTKISLNFGSPNNYKLGGRANDSDSLKPDAVSNPLSSASKAPFEPVASTSSRQDNFTFKHPTSHKLSKRKQVPRIPNDQVQSKHAIGTVPKFQNKTAELTLPDASENDFEDFNFKKFKPSSTSSFLSKATLKRQHASTGDPSPQKAKSHAPKRQKVKKKYNLILSQADVSGSDSSDGSARESCEEDYLEGSFIDDISIKEHSPNQQAMYLQSIKSCAGLPRGFKLKTNVDYDEPSFTHLEQGDSRYMIDSFCVDDDEVQLCSSEEEMPRPPKKREENRKGRKRKRILTLDDSSSSENDDFVRKLSGSESLLEPIESKERPKKKKSNLDSSSDEESIVEIKTNNVVEENNTSRKGPNYERRGISIQDDESSDEDDDFIRKIPPGDKSSFECVRTENRTRRPENNLPSVSVKENVLRNVVEDERNPVHTLKTTKMVSPAKTRDSLGAIDCAEVDGQKTEIDNQVLNIDLNYSFDVNWTDDVPDIFESELKQNVTVASENLQLTSACRTKPSNSSGSDVSKSVFKFDVHSSGANKIPESMTRASTSRIHELNTETHSVASENLQLTSVCRTKPSNGSSSDEKVPKSVFKFDLHGSGANKIPESMTRASTSRIHEPNTETHSVPSDRTLSDSALCVRVNRPTILVDSKELAGGKPIISLLRNKYNVNPVVMQLTTADYVISNRLAVERILDSDFSASNMPAKVIDKVKLMCDAYEKSFVIIQADSRKRLSGFNKLSSKYLQFSLNLNLHPSARVLFSNSFEESAAVLADIIQKEQRSGSLIDVPVVLNPTTQLLFDFYHSCPHVTPVCALRFVYYFPVVSMFLNSSVEALKKAGSVSTRKAISILEYFKSEILFDVYS